MLLPSSSSAIPNSPSSHFYTPSTAVFLKWYQIQKLSAGTHNFKGIHNPYSSRLWSTSYMLGNVLHSANAAHQSTYCWLFSVLAHQSWNELLTRVETSESTSNFQWGLKILFSRSIVPQVIFSTLAHFTSSLLSSLLRRLCLSRMKTVKAQ